MPSFPPGQAMVVLRVESRIGQCERSAACGRAASSISGVKCGLSDPVPVEAFGRENQMRGGMHGQGELGQSPVDEGTVAIDRRGVGAFSLVLALLAAFFIVPADMGGP